jgi:hypothetical protein
MMGSRVVLVDLPKNGRRVRERLRFPSLGRIVVLRSGTSSAFMVSLPGAEGHHRDDVHRHVTGALSSAQAGDRLDL